MKSGFAHFDGSHRENFCAAVLLLVMALDDAVRTAIATKVRRALDLGSSELVGFGREARLESSDNSYARLDIWLLFASATEQFDALIEVKTHNRWDPHHVHAQVHDQVTRGERVRRRQRSG